MLQFVPSHVDVRLCSFSERVEKGLLMAYAEVRKRLQENGNFTVHVRKSFKAKHNFCTLYMSLCFHEKLGNNNVFHAFK